MKKFSASLIGCGRIGFLLEDDPLRKKPCTHFGGAQKAGFSFISACDTNRERLSIFSKRASIKPQNLYTDYRSLLEKDCPDLAIISTWTESHHKIAIEASRRGASAIVLEKPISYSLATASKIIDECKKNSTFLFINHERRYDGKYNRVKNIIESGAIGKPCTVHASILTSGYRGKSSIHEGGGPLLHDGTHLVDIIIFLFGNIISVQGDFSRINRNKGFEDRAMALLKTESGPEVFIEAGGNRDYFQFELEISGTDGKIVVGNGYEKFYQKRVSRLYKGFKDLNEKKFPSFGKTSPFINIYKEVIECLSGKKERVTSSGNDGYAALETIHAIYLSSFKKGNRIELPLKSKKVDIKKIFSLD